MDKETMIKNVENLFGKNSEAAYRMRNVCRNYTNVKGFVEIYYQVLMKQKTMEKES